MDGPPSKILGAWAPGLPPGLTSLGPTTNCW